MAKVCDICNNDCKENHYCLAYTEYLLYPDEWEKGYQEYLEEQKEKEKYKNARFT